jgi:hypothetical protein
MNKTILVEIQNIKFPGKEFSCTPFRVSAKMDRQTGDGLTDRLSQIIRRNSVKPKDFVITDVEALH